jgi:opacity protein-like surface antigen
MMIREKIFARFALVILAIVATSPATADQSGAYADLDLGQAKYPYANIVDIHGVALSSVNRHIKDTYWGATVGYRFTPYFGSEVGYVNLGKGSAPVSDTSGTGTKLGGANFSSRGPTLALVGAVQLGNLEAFLRLGYLFAHVDLSVAATVDGPTKLNATISANTLAPFGGLGFRYAFSERWHLKFEFDHYDDVGDAATTGTATISVATLGVGYRF